MQQNAELVRAAAPETLGAHAEPTHLHTRLPHILSETEVHVTHFFIYFNIRQELVWKRIENMKVGDQKKIFQLLIKHAKKCSAFYTDLETCLLRPTPDFWVQQKDLPPKKKTNKNPTKTQQKCNKNHDKNHNKNPNKNPAKTQQNHNKNATKQKESQKRVLRVKMMRDNQGDFYKKTIPAFVCIVVCIYFYYTLPLTVTILTARTCSTK